MNCDLNHFSHIRKAKLVFFFLIAEKIGTLKTEILSHTALQEEIEKPTNGAAALKHLKQQVCSFLLRGNDSTDWGDLRGLMIRVYRNVPHPRFTIRL